jgi:hypothetical protein
MAHSAQAFVAEKCSAGTLLSGEGGLNSLPNVRGP